MLFQEARYFVEFSRQSLLCPMAKRKRTKPFKLTNSERQSIVESRRVAFLSYPFNLLSHLRTVFIDTIVRYILLDTVGLSEKFLSFCKEIIDAQCFCFILAY